MTNCKQCPHSHSIVRLSCAGLQVKMWGAGGSGACGAGVGVGMGGGGMLGAIGCPLADDLRPPLTACRRIGGRIYHLCRLLGGFLHSRLGHLKLVLQVAVVRIMPLHLSLEVFYLQIACHVSRSAISHYKSRASVQVYTERFWFSDSASVGPTGTGLFVLAV